jgi:hypothetical protein
MCNGLVAIDSYLALIVASTLLSSQRAVLIHQFTGKTMFQAGHDTSRLPRRLRLYNTVLDDRHDLLVRSVAVLLHPGADSRQLTGRIERRFPGEAPYGFLRYDVGRVWRIPTQQLLAGGRETLALAPISKVPQSELPSVIGEMERRLRKLPGRARAPAIWNV